MSRTGKLGIQETCRTMDLGRNDLGQHGHLGCVKKVDAGERSDIVAGKGDDDLF